MPARPRPLRVLAGTLTGLAVGAGALATAPAAPAAEAPPPLVFEPTYEAGVPADVRRAVDHALGIWAPLLSSTVPVRVLVSQTAVDGRRGALAVGSPCADTGRPGSQYPGAWYPCALEDALEGRDVQRGNPDIRLEFDGDWASQWYTGLDGRPGRTQQDVVTIALHEIAHGLGFGGWMYVNQDGLGDWGFGSGIAGVYDQHTTDGAGRRLLDYPHPSAELASTLTSGSVFNRGPLAVQRNGGRPVRLAAPPVFQPGSSYQHLDQAAHPFGTVDSLMAPGGSGGVAQHFVGHTTLGVLADEGWTLGPGAPAVPALPRVTGTASPRAVVAGGTVRLDAVVELPSPAGRLVEVVWRATTGGAETTVARVTTGADGRVSAVVRPARSGTYVLRHPGSRDTLYAGSAGLGVTVAQKITAVPARASARSGERVGVSGTVAPARAGAVVAVQRKEGTGWRSLGTVRTAADGRWTGSFLAGPRGRQTYRALVGAVPGLASGASPLFTVTAG